MKTSLERNNETEKEKKRMEAREQRETGEEYRRRVAKQS
jgi:hypothetical protein